MKLKVILIFSTIIVFVTSCSPRIGVVVTKKYPPLDYRQEVWLINLNEKVPPGSEKIGTVKVGDTGFSTNCDWDVVIDQAKLEARKIGGNAIKITDHKPPSVASTCHRITADILLISDIPTETGRKQEEVVTNADFATLNIYRFSGIGSAINFDLFLGDSLLCRVKNNFKTSLKVKTLGMNKLVARTESSEEVGINLEPGKSYYIKCSIKMGVVVGRPEIQIMDYQSGKEEFDSLLSRTK